MTTQGLQELVGGDPLSDNEIKVLLSAANGETAKQTAERLQYADDTIRDMRKYAIAKLCAKSITHAVAIALTTAVLNPDSIEIPE